MTTTPNEAPAAAPAALGRRGDPVTLSWVSVVLLFAALVLVSMALSEARVRVDLTEDGMYTLSPSSRRIAGGLTDPAQIRVYWGQKVPSAQRLVKRRIEGLLAEYQAAGQGHLTVTWVDMSGSEGPKEAAEKGVAKSQFQTFGASEISAVEDYQGLWMQYEGQTETVGPLSESGADQGYDVAGDLEYQITSHLWQMSRKKKVVVGVAKDAPGGMPWMNPHGGGGDRYSVLVGDRVLGATYKDSLKSWLNLDDPVPDDVGVLLVVAPREWSAKKAYHLEQFLLRGGKALVLLEAVSVAQLEGGTPAVRSGLEDWLKSYGVDLPEGVVADYAEEAKGVILDRQNNAYPYSYWVNLLGPYMSQDVPALRGIPSVMTFWPTEILADAKQQEAAGRRLTVLATTSEYGWRKSDTFGLNMRETDDPRTKTLGKHTVMAMLEGKFESFWKGKPAPDEPPPPPPKPPEEAAMGEPAMDGAAMDAAMGGTEPAMGDAAMTEPAMGTTPPPTPPAPPGMAPEPAMGAEAGMGSTTPPPAPSGPRGPEGTPGDKGPPKAKRLDEGRGVLVLVGDADFVSDEAAGRSLFAFNGKTIGFAVVHNLVDWLTGDEDILALRARHAKNRKFEEVGEDKANAIRWANFLVAPGFVTLVGLLVFFVRRHRR